MGRLCARHVAAACVDVGREVRSCSRDVDPSVDIRLCGCDDDAAVRIPGPPVLPRKIHRVSREQEGYLVICVVETDIYSSAKPCRARDSL